MKAVYLMLLCIFFVIANTNCQGPTVAAVSQEVSEVDVQNLMSILSAGLANPQVSHAISSLGDDTSGNLFQPLSGEMLKSLPDIQVALQTFKRKYKSLNQFYQQEHVSLTPVTRPELRAALAIGQYLSNKARGIQVPPPSYDEKMKDRLVYVSQIFAAINNHSSFLEGLSLSTSVIKCTPAGEHEATDCVLAQTAAGWALTNGRSVYCGDGTWSTAQYDPTAQGTASPSSPATCANGGASANASGSSGSVSDGNHIRAINTPASSASTASGS